MLFQISLNENVMKSLELCICWLLWSWPGWDKKWQMSASCWQCWPEGCQYSIQTKVSTPLLPSSRWALHYSHAAPWHVARDPWWPGHAAPDTWDMVWVTIAPLSLLSLSSLLQLASASLVAGNIWVWEDIKTLSVSSRLSISLADNEVGGYNVTWYLIDGDGRGQGPVWGKFGAT